MLTKSLWSLAAVGALATSALAFAATTPAPATGGCCGNSTGSCCSKSCCEGCPDCSCDKGCCDNCADGCDCTCES